MTGQPWTILEQRNSKSPNLNRFPCVSHFSIRALTMARRPETISKSWLLRELSMYSASDVKKGETPPPPPSPPPSGALTTPFRDSEPYDRSVQSLGWSTIFPLSTDRRPGKTAAAGADGVGSLLGDDGDDDLVGESSQQIARAAMAIEGGREGGNGTTFWRISWILFLALLLLLFLTMTTTGELTVRFS